MRRLAFSFLILAGLGVQPLVHAAAGIGQPAPDFTLQASDGKTYKLSDLKGKQAVVIVWYPAAFTQASTITCRSLVSNMDKLKKFPVTYFMASVDALDGQYGATAFAKSENANFPLLSDSSKKIAESYGVLGPNGKATLAAVYIAKDGRILAIDEQVRPLYAGEDMAARLAELMGN
jgi:peroxiredoxin Q/BCP